MVKGSFDYTISVFSETISQRAETALENLKNGILTKNVFQMEYAVIAYNICLFFK
jgi:hypothetical protein